MHTLHFGERNKPTSHPPKNEQHKMQFRIELDYRKSSLIVKTEASPYRYIGA